ncbi:MAG: response regulator [Pseudomonadales bacterium]|nr:response regulator [Pseudomonadales bacterium]
MTADNPSILLVEDNIAHVDLIRRVLEDNNLSNHLTVCKNLADARQVITARPPGLVITDLNLPDGKGIDLIEFSAGNSAYPVILMTSFGDENIAVQAIKLGALDYLVKSPEAFTSLPQTISRVMREWRHIEAKLNAQAALLQKDQEQEEILNSMLEAVITIDQDGLVLSFNSAAESLFGFTRKEIIGNNLHQLMPQQTATAHNDYIDRYLATGQAEVMGYSREVEAQHKDLSIFPIRLSVAELSPAANGKRRFIGSCQDLTLLKQQQEQLRRIQKMDALGKLTGGIAHDYNNILAIVLGYAEQIEHDKHQPDKVAIYSHHISIAAERGAKLAKKLMVFSRHKKPDISVMDINTLLREQEQMLQQTLTANITLRLELEQNLWPVELDQSDLVDAIINLSINAKFATKPGGSLTIRSKNRTLNNLDILHLDLKPGDYVLLSVTDTGHGMDPATIENIFDPFYSTKGESGTGLGLSQVYGFVERSHGIIRVDSEPGKGSCFALYFPRSLRSIPPPQNPVKTPKKPTQGNETILVVDDEPDMLKLGHKILTAQGYQVFTARDGQQALSILQQEKIDLVISDVIMPSMNGYQLAQQIHKNYPQTKVQMVSGFADAHYVDTIDDSLHQKILQKPFNSNILLTRVRSLLDE